MTDPIWDEAQLLRDAKAKAEKLMAGLIAQRQDLDRFADQIAPEKFAQGQKAFCDAIGSTRKAIEGIDQALRQCSGQALRTSNHAALNS